MYYFMLLIFLFDRFGSGEYTVSSGNGQGEVVSARRIVDHAKSCLESIIYIYYARHSFANCDTPMLSYFDLIGFGALKDLKSTNGKDRFSRLGAAILCAKGLREQANHFYMAEVFYVIMRDAMSPEVLRELEKDHESIENGEKRKRLMVEHVFSHYPLNSPYLHEVSAEHRLDELVKSYEALDLDGVDGISDIEGDQSIVDGNEGVFNTPMYSTSNDSRSPSTGARMRI